MPENVYKKAKRDLAIKKARRRKTVILTVISLVVLAVVVAMVISAVVASLTEVYTDGYATISLHPNGRFSAVMYHNERYNGTFVKSDNGMLVTFSYDGTTVTSALYEDILQIPVDWDDGHSHGYELPKK